MKANFKKYWQLFWHFRRIQLMRMMEFRGDFIFWTFISLMWTFFNFFFFRLLISVNNNIAGWSEYELYIILGLYTMIDALIWTFFYRNMLQYRRMIYNGELSNLLLKPVSSIYVLMTEQNNYNNIPRFFVGLLIVIWSLYNLQITPSLEQLAVFTLLFLTGSAFVYFGWFFVTTIAFWFDRLDNVIEIMPALRRIYEYPGSVYTGIFSLIFTTILPFTLVTTLPAETIIHEPNWGLTLYFMLCTAIVVVASIWFYNFSIKKYSSVGN